MAEPIVPPGFGPPLGMYSHGMVVPAGDLVIVAGQVGLGADGRVPGDDVISQTKQALENVRAVVEAAGCALAGTLRDAERSRHAEMHHQHFSGRQVGQQVLRPATETGHGLALHPLREILRQRPAQVAPPRLHGFEARALHHRLEAAPHGFDFRQFGHGKPRFCAHIAPLALARYGPGAQG